MSPTGCHRSIAAGRSVQGRAQRVAEPQRSDEPLRAEGPRCDSITRLVGLRALGNITKRSVTVAAAIETEGEDAVAALCGA
jgi:hypothetical protein